MDNRLKNKISLFMSLGGMPSDVSIISILNSIKAARLDDRIIKLRSLYLNNKSEYDTKKKSLPSVTFSGVFKGGHAKSNLEEYTSFLVLDIDHLEESKMKNVYNLLLNDEYVISFWKSPSGFGYKGLVYLDYDSKELSYLYHGSAFQDVRIYFKEKYDIELDKSGSDYSRLCFLSSDKDLVLKETYAPFVVECLPSISKVEKIASVQNDENEKRITEKVLKSFKNPNGKNNRMNRFMIDKIYKYLNKHSLSITEDYSLWFRVGMAIANTFSIDLGEEIYLKICRLDGIKHDEEASKKMLLNCYLKAKGSIKFNTIVYLAKDKGFKV